MGFALPDLRPSARGLGTETLEELEDRLLAADFGVEASLRLVDRVEALQRRGRLRGPEALRDALRDEVAKILLPVGIGRRGSGGVGNGNRLRPPRTRAGDRRLSDGGGQRGGEDHLRRQAGPCARCPGQEGPARRGGHLPGGRDLPAVHLGGPHRRRFCGRTARRGPRCGRLRRHRRGPRAWRGRRGRRHSRTPPHPDRVDGGTRQGAAGHRPQAAGRSARDPDRARRHRGSERARPGAGLPGRRESERDSSRQDGLQCARRHCRRPSGRSSGCRSSWSEWEKAPKTSSPSTQTRFWRAFSDLRHELLKARLSRPVPQGRRSPARGESGRTGHTQGARPALSRAPAL